MKITLEIARRSAQKTLTIDGAAARIGSDERAHVVLDDPEVQPAHAVLELGEGSATIIDLGSKEGTRVNDARINRCKLRPGDEIRVGGTLLRVVSIG